MMISQLVYFSKVLLKNWRKWGFIVNYQNSCHLIDNILTNKSSRNCFRRSTLVSSSIFFAFNRVFATLVSWSRLEQEWVQSNSVQSYIYNTRIDFVTNFFQIHTGLVRFRKIFKKSSVGKKVITSRFFICGYCMFVMKFNLKKYFFLLKFKFNIFKYFLKLDFVTCSVISS